MRKLSIFLFLLSLTILFQACKPGNSAQVTPTAAPVTISMITNPATPAIGDMTLQFTVVDQKGQPVTGADLDVIADHTDMGGMTMHGKASEQSNGVYAINANFGMAGNWKVTVDVRKGQLQYKQDIPLKIK